MPKTSDTAVRMNIVFTVPGNPTGKGRARAFLRKGRIAHATPEKTARYENLVKLAAMQAMAAEKAEPFKGAVSLICSFVMPVPKSYSKKRTADCLDGREWPAKRPDLDNCLKAIKDGCNGVIWADDCQVVDVRACKAYGASPFVAVEVRPI